MKPLLFALLAAIGNALFVYGQRGAPQSANPFLFTLGAVAVCFVLFVAAAGYYRDAGDLAYVSANVKNIIISGFGFFITFVGFFLLYTQYGASYYIVYALMAILTTSVGVGVLIYREPFNVYQWLALVLAMAAIALFTYGRGRGLG
jgi:drug/metabolite transporter (DMT)-like permease